MWTLLLAAAFAAPEVTTDDAGVVRGRVLVSAPVDRALALVRDPKALNALSEDGSTVTTAPDGTCLKIGYAMENPIANVAYTARGCPTASGFRTDLVQSETFRSMSSEWTVRAVEGKTEITYVYQADVAIPVPGFIIRRSTQSAITKAMTRVAARLEAP